ncbi:MAG: hypothetical protein HXX13_18495 [Bacteroidetes bacterium]|nr:hypothetical protein [Bacteroidota bacterium]
MNTEPKKSRYINFPICLLANAQENFQKTCSNILSYGLFIFCQSHPQKNKSEQFNQAMDYYKVTIENPELSYAQGERLFNEIPPKNPKAGISTKTLMDFYTNPKSEFEIDSFLAFCGMRSILQKKAYCKITNEYLLARMAGLTSPMNDQKLPIMVTKYQKRYQIDKLREQLQINWGLKLYSYHARGYYISFKLTIEELITQVEMRRAKSNKQRRISEKKAFVTQVLFKIGKSQYV